MTAAELPVLRWTAEEFVDAWEAGAFADRHRVQLVDGEVWDLGPIQGWHGDATARMARLLHADGIVVTTRTLPMPRSMPDPDAWVLRSGAEPVGSVRGYATYDPADVLLVVEVSDATLRADLTSKAAVYARAGSPTTGSLLATRCTSTRARRPTATPGSGSSGPRTR